MDEGNVEIIMDRNEFEEFIIYELNNKENKEDKNILDEKYIESLFVDIERVEYNDSMRNRRYFIY